MSITITLGEPLLSDATIEQLEEALTRAKTSNIQHKLIRTKELREELEIISQRAKLLRQEIVSLRVTHDECPLGSKHWDGGQGCDICAYPF